MMGAASLQKLEIGKTVGQRVSIGKLSDTGDYTAVSNLKQPISDEKPEEIGCLHLPHDYYAYLGWEL